ncbi:DUF427 domain-containing protein [uncultured Croceitalea sp.]|uniref:DUF427 domain-containing protein n=1 Tax=uncultured Croceitalea sp. TaxID=1798908 RepID=UPI003305DCDF
MGQKKIAKNTIPDWLLKSREGWKHTGQQRPSFAHETKAGQISVWDFPRPPALKEVSQKLAVYFNDICVARTQKGLAMLETASPPTYYFPSTDVNTALLMPMPGKTSLCEWKGKAQYWALSENQSSPIAWSYDLPFPPYRPLQGYFAFYPQQLSCFVDGEKVTPQPGLFYAGWITKNLTGPFKGEPGTGHW